MRTLFALLLSAPIAAFASDAVSIEYDRSVETGSSPSLRLRANEAVHATVELTCSERTYRLDQDIRSGAVATLSLTGLPDGRHRCDGRMAVRSANGSTGESHLAFETAVQAPLAMTTTFEEVDLVNGRITVHANRPIQRVEVRAIGIEGQPVGRGAILAGAGTDPTIQWSPNDQEVLVIEVEGRDIDGAGQILTLTPWSYEIPHTDVVFGTNLHDIAPDEVPKLEAAWGELVAVIQKYGAVVQTKLFVGGYTDTVGTPDTNDALSGRRARAIAQWFRTRGYRGEIYYSGFGERALAVPTADGTDEVRNRRAVYVVAAEQPGGADFPNPRWTPIP
jgi:outer membrane protein OmpA-like peptidoglycan-associated protein